ncbi:ring-finger-containing e3 ubiquitin ligase [Stylonychia lemnae]|uniref:RING-type E3 ubiquitin transferase BRCA1 n=1 Tax=Stylonychia lemnae TaxID=5949 RepID=A0A078B5T5_STYLE|nr:ring-finger-containing e3 ubiquitin ligase [Stylonychia lemnae]|eukprot:CDW88672.1 ring-finger-containing e3 ubiquitin ligase [Stylonychia lemnae]
MRQSLTLNDILASKSDCTSNNGTNFSLYLREQSPTATLSKKIIIKATSRKSDLDSALNFQCEEVKALDVTKDGEEFDQYQTFTPNSKNQESICQLPWDVSMKFSAGSFNSKHSDIMPTEKVEESKKVQFKVENQEEEIKVKQNQLDRPSTTYSDILQEKSPQIHRSFKNPGGYHLSDELYQRMAHEFRCPICKDIPEKVWFLACAHFFCEGCLQRQVNRQKTDTEFPRCAECNQEFSYRNKKKNQKFEKLLELFKEIRSDNNIMTQIPQMEQFMFDPFKAAEKLKSSRLQMLKTLNPRNEVDPQNDKNEIQQNENQKQEKNVKPAKRKSDQSDQNQTQKKNNQRVQSMPSKQAVQQKLSFSTVAKRRDSTEIRNMSGNKAGNNKSTRRNSQVNQNNKIKNERKDQQPLNQVDEDEFDDENEIELPIRRDVNQNDRGEHEEIKVQKKRGRPPSKIVVDKDRNNKINNTNTGTAGKEKKNRISTTQQNSGQLQNQRRVTGTFIEKRQSLEEGKGTDAFSNQNNTTVNRNNKKRKIQEIEPVDEVKQVLKKRKINTVNNHPQPVRNNKLLTIMQKFKHIKFIDRAQFSQAIIQNPTQKILVVQSCEVLLSYPKVIQALAYGIPIVSCAWINQMLNVNNEQQLAQFQDKFSFMNYAKKQHPDISKLFHGFHFTLHTELDKDKKELLTNVLNRCGGVTSRGTVKRNGPNQFIMVHVGLKGNNLTQEEYDKQQADFQISNEFPQQFKVNSQWISQCIIRGHTLQHNDVFFQAK